MSKPNYCIPQPDRLRRIDGSFAWIDHRLLRNGFLPLMTHQDQSLYLFLALAGDRNGISFYRKEKICDLLGLDFGQFEVARDRLIELGLIAFQPYSALTVNGFYQVLPVDHQAKPFALSGVTPAAPQAVQGPRSTATPRAAEQMPMPQQPRGASSSPAVVADPIAQLAASFRTI